MVRGLALLLTFQLAGELLARGLGLLGLQAPDSM